MDNFTRNIIIGWRNILKNKLFSFLNIGGVAIAIAVSSLILFWVVDELSYDKFHTNLDQIYTVYEHQVYSDGQDLHTNCTPFPLANYLKSNIAGIETATTFTNFGPQTAKFNNKEHKDITLFISDEAFFKVFTFKILEGEASVLKDPGNVIVSKSLATRIFGGQSPIGKVIKLRGKYDMVVAGVMEDVGSNSTIQFNMLGSVQSLKEMGANLSNWNSNWPQTSVLLSNEADVNIVEEQITNICKEQGQDATTLHLFPQSKERLYTYNGKRQRIQYVYQFIVIAFIIMLIASINFVNASTASSETRRQEVGVRKVLGASKFTLAKQFVYEKALMMTISIFFGVQLILLFSPVFNHLSGKKMSFRSMLIVVQFSLSIILIICTLTVTAQLKYINNFDLGYNTDNLIYINLDDATKTKHSALTTEFLGISGVVNVTKADKLPLFGGNSSWGYDWQGKDPEKKVLICAMRVDDKYFETMGIRLAEGRAFSASVMNNESETPTEVILNKEVLQRIGMNNPIGKFFGRSNWKSSIVGVTDNFHFETLKTGVEPLLMTPLKENPNVIIIRVNPNNFVQTLASIKAEWTKIIPDSECEIGFLDERVEQMYSSELRISGLFKYFSFVAIFIACIGLLGLSFYAIERKKKEIGVRKVNGSTIAQVLLMLNKGFVKWVAVGFIIACPIAYYAMNKWLQNFAYKTELSWWIFALAGVLALGIALLTVSWQSWRAATRNPVEALRYE